MLTNKQIANIKSGLDSDRTAFPLVFQALGDPCRFSIFRMLMDNHDICVTDVAKIFDITVSAVSQQLRILERLGLVFKVRKGQTVCYKINTKNTVVKQLIKII